MTQTDPGDRYYVGGAGLRLTTPNHRFPYATARRFQHKALKWIADSDPDAPVSALAAPTGAGKTAVIAALAANARNGAVATYPTNKLVTEQADALRSVPEYDLSVKHVTGDTLSGTGEQRSNELLDIARDHGTDVVVTNPDILQAVVQDAYFSPGGRVMEFYSYFDAAIFDEFHYYDPLAASGLLTQINVLSARGTMLDYQGNRRPPRVLLSSATPDERFVTHIADDLGIPVQIIRSDLISLDISREAGFTDDIPNPGDKDGSLIYTDAGSPDSLADTSPRAINEETEAVPPSELCRTVPDSVGRFRYPMRIDRYDAHITEDFDAIAERLLSTVEDEYEYGAEPVAALVFNSAARSNDFQAHINTKYSRLAELTWKDNGYDTRARRPEPDAYAVLNTTSKGEVGLDYDLSRLIVVAPWTAGAFIQRIGRAARASPAVVEMYGLDDPSWPSVQSYAEFLYRVLGVRGGDETNRDQLAQLAGLRGSRAISERYQSETWHPDIKADFGSLPMVEEWRDLVSVIMSDDVDEALQASFGAGIDRDGHRALVAAREALRGVDALRGRTVTAKIEYPLGDALRTTEYDLIRALRHYDFAERRNGRVILDADPPHTLRGYYPGEPFDNDGIDLLQGTHTLEERLTEQYTSLAQHADLTSVEVSPRGLAGLFYWLPLQPSLVPEAVDTATHRLIIDTVTEEVTDVTTRHGEGPR